jgi:hypothetical protein
MENSTSFSLTPRRLFTKNLSWLAKQLILHTMVTVWKCAKTSHWTMATKELAAASWQCTIFHQRIFLPKNNMTVIPHLFTCLTLAWRYYQVDTTVVIEAESRAVLNTFINHKHDFQDMFKKMTGALGTMHTHGRGLLHGWWWPVGQNSFWPECSTSPRN